MPKPLAIDLFCGKGGWTRGLLATGWRVIGFDILRFPDYPSEQVVQDVLTIHGAQLRDAGLIVASPPCTEPSYRAMPWKRAKALNAAGPPHKFIELFDACFRIQREASEEAGRYIPMLVENVKGAQPWVGRARWHYGSFYLWGDVPALMPPANQLKRPGRNFHVFEKGLGSSPSFNGADHETRGVKQNGSGPEWFDNGLCKVSSKSDSRKEASAQIAMIPYPLARWIGQVFYPSIAREEHQAEQADSQAGQEPRELGS